MAAALKLLFVLVAGGSVALGVALLAAPKWVIEAQIRFYRCINWKMEPLSWEKEIRNTRFMGALALLCGLLTSLVMLTK